MSSYYKKSLISFIVIIVVLVTASFANLEYLNGFRLPKKQQVKFSWSYDPEAESSDTTQSQSPTEPFKSEAKPSQSPIQLLRESPLSSPSDSPSKSFKLSLEPPSQSPTESPSSSPSDSPSKSFKLSLEPPSQSSTESSSNDIPIEQQNPKLSHPLLPRRCLSFSEDMDELVQRSKQVYIVMLPKAAGTTAAHFAKACTKDPKIYGNFLNWEDRVEDFFTHSLKMPSILASHLYVGDKTLKRIIKQTTRDDLIIYLHREETDRVMSAIKMVVEDWLCGGKAKRKPNAAPMLINHPELYRLEESEEKERSQGKGESKNNGNGNANANSTMKKCTVSEKSLVKTVIKNRSMELSLGAHRVLTCDAYETIEEHAPNMIFMDYRQMDKLQHVLAKHHCPELVPDLPMQLNVSAQKEAFDIQIELSQQQQDDQQNKKMRTKEVAFPEWLDAKRELMEYALDIKKNPKCLAKTRVMENDLNSCPDKILQVSSSSFSTFHPNL